MNPYESPPEAATVPAPNWYRRWIVLNSLLVFIPLSMVLVIWTWLQIELYIAWYSNTGDPIMHQHSIWVGSSFPIWSLTAYLLVPNIGMYVAYSIFARKMTKGQIEDRRGPTNND